MKRLLIACIFASSPALAQWQQEPRAVLGVALGQPVTLPRCESGAGLCVQQQTLRNFVSLGGVDLPGISGGSLLLHEGRVRLLSLRFPQTKWDQVISMLTERYGPPHTKDVGRVTTLSGAVLTARSYTWTGPSTAVKAIERSESIDFGGIYFSDVATEQAASQQTEKASREAASKL